MSTLCPLQEVKLFDEHEIKLIEDIIGQRRYVTWNVEFCAQFFSSFDAISDSLLAPLPSEIRPVGICYLSLVKDFFYFNALSFVGCLSALKSSL